jgi:2-hydroxy-3-keto-5-methylthiopentenyl-1-phosphate phosphatase
MDQIQFFLDFDGTITTADVVDAVLNRFADPCWKDIEKQWIEGKIGSRECLSRQIDLVKATPEELKELLRGIKVDPHFVSFLKCAEELAVPVAIVSDGFDIMIEQILKQTLQEIPHLLKAIPVFSNKLIWKENRWQALFPHDMMCSHGCANCKPVIMKKLSSRADLVVFVGDGLSDRFAAKKASLTFAKGKLLSFCEENKYIYKKYSGFKEIETWLSKNHAKLTRAKKKTGWLDSLKGLFPWNLRKKNS